MSRLLNLALLTVMLIGAVVTYDMKLKAEKAAERVVKLEGEIAEQKDAVQLLRAELSMLVQPGRLQVVVDRHADHFQLEDFSPSQYATVEEIPVRIASPTDDKAMATMADGNARDGRTVSPESPR